MPTKTKSMTLTNKASTRFQLLSLGLPLLLLASLILLAFSIQWEGRPDNFATALTLDFVLSVPVLYYLLIRKNPGSKLGVASFFAIGVLAASLVIPAEQQTLLSYIRSYLFPVIELGVVGFILFKVNQLIRQSRKASKEHEDFISALRQSTKEVFPPLPAKLMATEISLVYYGLFAWGKRTFAANEYSYHKKSGAFTMYGVLIFMVLIETFAAHILVEQWSNLAAWILSISSIYVIFQILAMLKAMPRRPIVLGKDLLTLRSGLAADCNIPYDQIESIELTRRTIAKEEGVQKIALSEMLDSHNLVLRLKEEVDIQGLYGQSKKGHTLMVWVDDRDRFYQAIQEKINA